MRILFLSDIHGVPSTLEQALAAAEPLNYDKIVLLGYLLMVNILPFSLVQCRKPSFTLIFLKSFLLLQMVR